LEVLIGFPAASAISNHVAIVAALEIRLESRELLIYPLTETKAIVPRIARIEITTMSSTRVNPENDFFCFFGGMELQYKNINFFLFPGRKYTSGRV
jgi:hypothetical protein